MVLLPTDRNTPLLVARFERNNKAVNLLFSALGTLEYERVGHFETTHEIWTTLKNNHEWTATVKARLFQTH